MEHKPDWQDDWKAGYVPPKPRNWQWVLRKGRWKGFSRVSADSIHIKVMS